MLKLNNDQRMEIYHKRKQGVTIAALAKEDGLNTNRIKYLVRLLNRHGQTILRDGKNKVYPPALKKEIINKVLIEHQSITETAIEYVLISERVLSNWLKSYKENRYTIVKKREVDVLL